MRIIVSVIILVVFGGILSASAFIEDRELSAAELENVRAACPTCHGLVPNYDQALAVHDKHAALDCSRCHSADTPIPPSTSPTPEPATSPLPTEGPPSIPHTLQGRDNCLACHETGSGSAPKIPVDHAGRTNELCTACHATSK